MFPFIVFLTLMFSVGFYLVYELFFHTFFLNKIRIRLVRNVEVDPMNGYNTVDISKFGYMGILRRYIVLGILRRLAKTGWPLFG